MMHKNTVLHAHAQQDIDDVLDYYLSEARPIVALDFIDQLEHSLRHIARHPGTGSPRYAHELDLPGLRCWQIKHHPYLIFYIEQGACINVWRILHASRDIPHWMQETGHT